MITYTFLGALILWCKDLPEQRRAYCLSEIWEHLEIRNSKGRYIAELCAFLIIGTVIALGVAKPTRATQALAAGIGWTALFSSTRNPARRRAEASR